MSEIFDSAAEANRLLSEAGWTPLAGPMWSGKFCANRMVGGIAPGGDLYVKSLDAVLPGDPRYGYDTPDEYHEAAAWLIEHVRNPAIQALETPHATNDLGAGYAGAGMDFAYRADDPIGGGGSAGFGPDDVVGGGAGSRLPESEGSGSGPRYDAGEDALCEGGDPGAGYGEAIDADFSEFGDEPAGLEGADELGGEMLEFAPSPGQAPRSTRKPEPFQGQDRFIGLDDLDRRRLLRIGETIRYAKTLLPPWSGGDHNRLVELRNFVMGVSEGRWPDRPAFREELVELEATRGAVSAIEAARDAKVAFLEAASREEVDGYAIEADWP